ncbi:hypothetical protein [Flavobacterium oreochromis]|uniref:hypothetical protein n=1 Tax=Flavobacterium oreochromis TaxID=2906078 RepID=UPI001CE6A891|nr:hypothetical protein [Flavobacterium oreochromis]QYS86507.1 hypothetical protein JJC03_16760 [Flavobacterium oreochromis]
MKLRQYQINFFFLMTAIFSFSQTKNIKNQLNSETVIQLVKEKGLLLIPNGLKEKEIKTTPSLAPQVTFNPKKSTWTVVSSNYTTTQEGDCKKTNGCTVLISQTVVISGITKKIISSHKSKKLYPNYE